MDKKTIVFDFDGVIHRYSKGWNDGTIYDIPTDGIKETIEELRNEYKIVIVSTRSATEEGRKDIAGWLRKYNIEVDDITAEKPPAIMYIDDRAVHFNGNCKTLMRDIKNFRCWAETARKTCQYCGKEFFDANNNTKYCSTLCRISYNVEKSDRKVVR